MISYDTCDDILRVRGGGTAYQHLYIHSQKARGGMYGLEKGRTELAEQSRRDAIQTQYTKRPRDESFVCKAKKRRSEQ